LNALVARAWFVWSKDELVKSHFSTAYQLG